MIEVKLNKSNENPFFGLRNCLKLQQASTDTVISVQLLNDAWAEVAHNKEKREMFFSNPYFFGKI